MRNYFYFDIIEEERIDRGEYILEENHKNKFKKKELYHLTKGNMQKYYKENISIKTTTVKKYIMTFLKWIVVAGFTGVISGLVGILFHISVEAVTEVRLENDFIIWFLPLGGLLIVWLYKMSNMEKDRGTNLVISSIRTDDKVPFLMAPLIFVSTVITHLFGGSSGREGAALQLGGSIGTQIGKLFKLSYRDMNIVIMCGMSGVFSALFGTPITATFFAMEVISVGIIHYSSFIPCVTAALIAYMMSLYCGLEPVRYSLKGIPDLSVGNIGLVILLGILCAVLSMIFCILLHKTHKTADKYIKNSYIRIAVGGIIIVILTYLMGTRDYNGAGMDVIENAMNGNAISYAFIMKIIFTVVTIGFGYKGGEIVPTFFIGATFGCVVAPMLGLNPCFGAAIALIALFCGMTNTLITSIILSIELFGSQGLIFFAVACGVSYMFSGYYSLYGSQKIMYSKLRTEYINRDAE